MMIVRSIVLTIFLISVVFETPVSSQQDDDSFIARELKVFRRYPWPWPPRGDGCAEPNAFFDSSVVVTFEGDSNGVDASIFMELEDAFLEAYNTLRKDFCDEQSRKVVDVEVDQDSLVRDGLNEFSLLFEVRGGCDRCSTADATLFEVEPQLRRDLAAYKRRYHNIIHGGMLSNTPKPSPSPINGASIRGGKNCCPPGGPRRAPFASEFATAFDAVYKAVGTTENRKLQGVPIDLVIKAVEVTSVTCEEEEREFGTNIIVEFGGNSEPKEGEIFALEATFESSYNGFREEAVCDPLFRIITEVTTVAVEVIGRNLHQDDRKLQTRQRFTYKIRGRCRGCQENQRLFEGGSSGRLRRLEMTYSRQLQFVADDRNCFCAVGAQERGVFEDEFVVAYDDTVQELRDEGIVESVDTVETVDEEPSWTWSPTTSPTNYPTGPTDSPVPSPSPSLIPSARPSDSPS